MPITIRVVMVVMLLINSVASVSQTAGVQVLCRPQSDSIMLRWGPSDASTWRLGNRYGYEVMRYTILKNKKIPKEIEGRLMTPEPLRPLPLERWEPYVTDRYAAIAAECLYGSYYKGVPTGNSPHLAYQKYREEQHRFSFALYAADQSRVVAGLSGLYWVDRSARADEKYLYKVYIPCPDSVAVDTGSVFTGLTEAIALPKPMDLTGRWDDRKVMLSWSVVYHRHIYNRYQVEKSLDGGHTFSPISDNALVQASDVGVSPDRIYREDSLPDNRTTIYYRVRGFNAFGELGPPSDSIFGTGTLPLTEAPVMADHVLLDNRAVQLTWSYPEAMNAYIQGFKVYRSHKPKGRKQLVMNGADPQQRHFIDSVPGITNYYLLSVYNGRQEKLSPMVTYVERVDSFPPQAPVGLMGEIDSAGVVTVRWHGNGDDDLSGYRVYASNHPDFEYLLMTPDVHRDTVYRDTIQIRTLTRQVFYRVKAVDVRDNQSAFSEVLPLTRPDVVCPVSPLLQGVDIQKGQPVLRWLNSPSEDVIYYQIYRKTEGDTMSVLLHRQEAGKGQQGGYTDRQALPGKRFIYHVVAEDRSGLVSSISNTVWVSVPSGVEERIELKKRVQTDRVVLSWKVTGGKTLRRVIVYRAVGQEPLRLYGHSTDDRYTDGRLTPGRRYRYAVKAVYDDETTSPLSESVEVKF